MLVVYNRAYHKELYLRQEFYVISVTEMNEVVAFGDLIHLFFYTLEHFLITAQFQFNLIHLLESLIQ